jgi:hypothetical protein
MLVIKPVTCVEIDLHEVTDVPLDISTYNMKSRTMVLSSKKDDQVSVIFAGLYFDL